MRTTTTTTTSKWEKWSWACSRWGLARIPVNMADGDALMAGLTSSQHLDVQWGRQSDKLAPRMRLMQVWRWGGWPSPEQTVMLQLEEEQGRYVLRVTADKSAQALLGERPAGSRWGWRNVKVLVSPEPNFEWFFSSKGWPVKDLRGGRWAWPLVLVRSDW